MIYFLNEHILFMKIILISVLTLRSHVTKVNANLSTANWTNFDLFSINTLQNIIKNMNKELLNCFSLD